MKNRFIPIAAAAFAVSQIACGFLKPRIEPYPVGLVFPVVAGDSLDIPGRIATPIRSRGGKAYFGTREGLIWCMDGYSRQFAWKFETGEGPIGSLSLGLENVYVAGGAGTLYCLGPAGDLKWKMSPGETLLTPVVEGGGGIFFGTGKGKLWSLDLNGNLQWQFPAGGPVGGGPLFLGNMVACGSGDGTVHFISSRGKSRGAFRAGAKILGPMASDGKLVFFNTEARDFYGVSIAGLKKKWKVRLQGSVFDKVMLSGKRLYALGANSVLYCLNARGGDIRWWVNVPARDSYDLEIVGDKVVVSTPSVGVLAFDALTGRKSGEYKAAAELRANTVWLDPFLIVADFDAKSGKGKFTYLRKEVRVGIAPQKASPRPVGEEIGLTATAVGFHLPKYEFYLKRGDQRDIGRTESEKNTWSWYADKEGTFTVGVKVTDVRQTLEAEIPFVIDKAPEKKSGEPVPAKPPKKARKKEKTK
jgi:outer membrane protein assembly factor BamB